MAAFIKCWTSCALQLWSVNLELFPTMTEMMRCHPSERCECSSIRPLRRPREIGVLLSYALEMEPSEFECRTDVVSFSRPMVLPPLIKKNKNPVHLSTCFLRQVSFFHNLLVFILISLMYTLILILCPCFRFPLLALLQLTYNSCNVSCSLRVLQKGPAGFFAFWSVVVWIMKRRWTHFWYRFNNDLMR